tara:strand:- start:108 stop:599 length:492 start_codon:yes stop_codon:yes gene_type:complete
MSAYSLTAARLSRSRPCSSSPPHGTAQQPTAARTLLASQENGYRYEARLVARESRKVFLSGGGEAEEGGSSEEGGGSEEEEGGSSEEEGEEDADEEEGREEGDADPALWKKACAEAEGPGREAVDTGAVEDIGSPRGAEEGSGKEEGGRLEEGASRALLYPAL